MGCENTYCIQCRFWEQPEHEKEQGRCHKHSPAPLFPETGSFGWCGDWEVDNVRFDTILAAIEWLMKNHPDRYVRRA